MRSDRTMHHRAMGFTLLGAVSILLLALTAISAFGQRGYRSDSNGVYGGFVASDKWFDDMTRMGRKGSGMGSGHSADEAALAAGTHTQVALQIVFPEGNFNPSRPPTLVIGDGNGRRTGLVARMVQASNTMAVYHLILQKGSRYTLQWMSTFGKQESFGAINVPRNAGSQMVVAVKYQRWSSKTPAEAAVFQRTPQGYVPPQSAKGWHSPEIMKGWTPPRTDAPPSNPKEPAKKCDPRIPLYSQRGCVP